MSINLGVPGDFRRQRIGWNNRDGDFGEVEYEGSQGFIQTQHASLRNGNNVIESEIWNEGAKWMLRARISIGAPNQSEQGVTDDVRMAVNRVHKSIFEPPYPGTGTLTADDIETIRKALNSQSDADILAVAELNDESIALYLLAQAGVESRIVYQPVLFRSRSASDGYNWPDAGGNVGRIHNEAQLYADAALDGIINFQLPPSGGTSTVAGETFRYGWLKHEPWYDTAAGNRTVEFREYEFGLWPEFLYATAT